MYFYSKKDSAINNSIYKIKRRISSGYGPRNAIMEEKWSIDKLDGTNWPTWKFQMKHLLLTKGLWKIVGGTETLKVGASSVLEAEFEKNSQRAFSTIVLGMQSSQLYLITPTEEPKVAWDALTKHFERETLVNKLFLKKRYFRMEILEGTCM